ncbi:hypothetical protein [Phaeacidiphilus oryzae]|uniref:hypothetical protein n=1 Tax=Phaeacidiphilus oryzae TaxID=348818 RepID=UPI0005638C43|nr:hypothetical protein [Phaeacidiphilus oryzae]
MHSLREERDENGPAGADDPPGHQVTVTERGSFAVARCSCGWSAPARRSRDRARSDAAEHGR